MYFKDDLAKHLSDSGPDPPSIGKRKEYAENQRSRKDELDQNNWLDIESCSSFCFVCWEFHLTDVNREELVL